MQLKRDCNEAGPHHAASFNSSCPLGSQHDVGPLDSVTISVLPTASLASTALHADVPMLCYRCEQSWKVLLQVKS